MKQQQSIAQQFGIAYSMVALNVEGMTKEQSLTQPATGGNCSNWILGHLVDVHNNAMGLAGTDPVWDSDQLKKAGYEPIKSAAGAIEWDTLRSKFLDSKDRCLSAIAKLSDASLEETFPHPFGGTATRAELLSLLALHMTYHAGQLGIARRIAGLPGVIKAPGQREREAAARV